MGYVPNEYIDDIQRICQNHLDSMQEMKMGWVHELSRINTGINFVQPGLNTLSNAVSIANEGDILYLDNGTYEQTEAISITSKSLTIIGAGPRNSIITCTGCHGILVNTNATDKTVVLRDFEITTTNAGTYTAITLQAGLAASVVHKQFLVENVFISGSVYADDYWENGILFQDAWASIVSNCYIRGKYNTTSMTSGIIFAATVGYTATEVQIINTWIFFANTGVYVGERIEGVTVSECTIVYINYGVHWDMTAQKPMCNVIGTHISAFYICIYGEYMFQSSITDNLLYKRSDSSQNFVAISLYAGNDVRIANNTMIGAGAGGTENGLVLDHCDYCTVTGNTFNEMDTMIWFKADSNYNVAVGNTGTLYTNIIVDDATDNTYVCNMDREGLLQGDLFLNSTNPVIGWIPNSGDYLRYDTTNNYHQMYIGDVEEFRLSSTQLVLGSLQVKGVSAPTVATDAANKDYVDTAIGGIPGVTDHGGLTGLADDDHAQYLLTNGTRYCTGDFYFNKANPSIIFDTNDFYHYDKTNNYHNFYIAGNIEMSIGPGGTSMGSNKILNVATPTANYDGATKKYVDDKMAAHIAAYH